MSTADTQRLLTVREAAERMAVSEITVRRLLRRGELPAVRLGPRGHAVRIDAAALERWLYSDPRDAA